MELVLIPQEKIAAATRGLSEAFGVAAFDDIRDLTARPGSNRAFRIVVRGSAYLLRINTRAGETTRHFGCMQAAAEAGLARASDTQAPKIESRSVILWRQYPCRQRTRCVGCPPPCVPSTRCNRFPLPRSIPRCTPIHEWIAQMTFLR
jgi:hypothetical protein